MRLLWKRSRRDLPRAAIFVVYVCVPPPLGFGENNLYTFIPGGVVSYHPSVIFLYGTYHRLHPGSLPSLPARSLYRGPPRLSKTECGFRFYNARARIGKTPTERIAPPDCLRVLSAFECSFPSLTARSDRESTTIIAKRLTVLNAMKGPNRF